jgi:hypothetical protein
MKAILHVGAAHPWVDAFGGLPWALLPVANRPLIDYWLEACAEQGIGHVQIIMGDGAERIEQFAGDGTRWGLRIQYGFARPNEQPLDYVRQTHEPSDDGLLFIGGPVFLRRRQAFRPAGYRSLDACRFNPADDTLFLFGKTAGEVRLLLAGDAGSVRGLEQIHIHPFPIDSVAAYYELNMKMVRGEFQRYVTAGYGMVDGSSVGYNVLTPPSALLHAPIILGNDCRMGIMSTVGPNAVIADHVIVDSRSELSNCIILQDTYIGQNLEINRKIVSGKRLIDPVDGTVVEIDDSWVVARNRPDMRTDDFVRYCILWFLALGVALAQLLPFCILYPLVRITRIGAFQRKLFHDPKTGHVQLPVFTKLENRRSVLYSLFRAAALDRFPWLLLALRGRLFVCGQPPMRHPEDDEIVTQLTHYYPAVFSYADYNKDSARLADSLWYVHVRSLFEDTKILIKSLLHRFFRAGR